MRITSRRKAIAFAVVLGVCLVALAVALDVGWIILNWRQGILLFLGGFFFVAIIAGLILNTSFLVHEIRLNEQHSSFINAVTHELKTPIASIRLYLETLQRRDVGEAQRQQFYRLMLLDTDRLLGSVEQVLKAGEVGYKKKSRPAAEIDFGGLVRECIELTRLRHHLQPEAVRYQDANGASSFKVLGDADELRTALINVLDNAVKFSGNNVDVWVRIESPGEDRVALHVRDHGVGIPPEELKNVFRRFYRVTARPQALVKGTGLGLFIVRSIVRKHGGTVSAESEGVGRGATITLELPRSPA